MTALATSMVMGPPLSPREPRRSGRRSLPAGNGGSSTSKSSKSTSPGPENGNLQHHTSGSAPVISSSHATSATGSGHGKGSRKRVKEEDGGGAMVVQATASGSGKRGGGGGKKRSKKEERIIEVPIESPVPDIVGEDGEDLDEGETRCVCGRGQGQDGEDEDSFSFWIQCETCKVWQHGQCVGYDKEEDAPEHYHCEQCRPDLHEALLKRLAKQNRTQRTTSTSNVTRTSRSRSPGHALAHTTTPLTTKRRNTMNSRETAYHDQILKQVLDHPDDGTSLAPSSVHLDEELEAEAESIGRKRSKRSETAPVPEQPPVHGKGSRSESSASDRPIATTLVDSLVVQSGIAEVPDEDSTSAVVGLSTPVQRTQTKVKKKKEDGKRHPNQYTYRKAGAKQSSGSKDPSTSSGIATGQQNTSGGHATPASHDHSTRRNLQSSRSHPHSSLPAAQPPFTSWGLPDYLAHLSSSLPTGVPVPLSVPGIGEDRGVKVKWPGKRMSINDMGKRVRSLMEWLSREQVAQGERERRREAIERALDGEVVRDALMNGPHTAIVNGVSAKIEETDAMDVDGPKKLDNKLLEASLINGMAVDPPTSSQAPNPTSSLEGPPFLNRMTVSSSITSVNPAPNGIITTPANANVILGPTSAVSSSTSNPSPNEKTTTQLMEELMLDIIGFQERFGSQAKMKELLSF